MNAQGLERILLPDKSDSLGGFHGEFSDVGNLFMKSLGIEQIVSQLFRFNAHETKMRALNIIQKLSTTLHELRQRQKCLRYLIEAQNYSEIRDLFVKAYYNFESISGFNVFINDYSSGFSKTIISPYLLNQYFQLYKELLLSVKSFGTLTAQSPFGFFVQMVDEVTSSQSFKKLERKFPVNSSDDFKNEELYNELYRKVNEISGTMEALDYYFGFADGFRRLMKMGAGLVFPEISEGPYRICEIKDGVNFLLYLGANNDKKKIPVGLDCDELQPIRLITGENMYGKTMALKTRGVIQAFAQTGLPVIASEARVSLVDRILANIGLTEDSLKGRSTYQNINETTFRMIKYATPRSLLLLDEPTSGTYDLKAVAQAEIYLRSLVEAGYQAWIVTHHLQLTDLTKELPQIVNLTTEVINGEPTFRLVEGVFSPTTETLKLDYPPHVVNKAAATGINPSQLGKDKRYNVIPTHKERLIKLLDEGKISQDRLDAFRRLYKN